MKIYKDIDCAYEVRKMAWSGGADTLDDLTDNEIETIIEILEDCNNGEPWGETDLNDFLWFERDTIAEWLGYNDYEEIMNR